MIDRSPVGIGTSLFLIALGAVLKFAVHTSVEGFSIGVIGVILMIVGIIGLLMSFFFNSRRETAVVDHAVVEERPVARERVVERDL